MKRLFAFIAASALALSAWAQSPSVSGEVTKIDKPGGRVTLKHGEIKHLDMPPMTMVFRVAKPSLLDDLAVGSRIRFTVERIDGAYTVTGVSKAP
ncbi:MAG: copper-binding protein [Rubrivivax sp.]|nr:copper-binding protein [Rubrivivax sp.]